MKSHKKTWFWGAVVYQIYPRSFYDTNSDGVGDLKGIIAKLDYLAGTENSLGVSAIWLCPFYKSPMADFGYDVSDYQSVDPIFGSLDDFRELIQQAHHRGTKVIIDLVANHTSDEHPWFLESKSSKINAKRDWYIWRDGNGGEPPNDWLSVFGGSAWRYDSSSGQYYLHSFSVKQPDLNWENQEVRQAIKDVMHFWLKLGIDGFRADAVYWLSKDHRLRDDPSNLTNYDGDQTKYGSLKHTFSQKGPRLYKYLREITAVLKNYDERIMIIEAMPEGGKETVEYLKFYRLVDEHVVAPFNFEGVYLPWDAKSFKSFIDEFQSALKPDYLPVYTLGNHDRPRLASRVGPAATKTAAMMLLTLPGMPFIYYGEEIGMTNVPVPEDKKLDPQRAEGFDRDEVRTPFQWNGQSSAGFSDGEPWLPLSPTYQGVNLEGQIHDQNSLFNLYRQLIRLRNSSDALKSGDYESLYFNEYVFGFGRRLAAEKIVVILNFSQSDLMVDLGSIGGQILLSTYQDIYAKPVAIKLNLRPHEGVIISCIV